MCEYSWPTNTLYKSTRWCPRQCFAHTHTMHHGIPTIPITIYIHIYIYILYKTCHGLWTFSLVHWHFMLDNTWNIWNTWYYTESIHCVSYVYIWLGCRSLLIAFIPPSKWNLMSAKQAEKKNTASICLFCRMAFLNRQVQLIGTTCSTIFEL